MDLEFNKNEDSNKQLVYEMKNRLKKIYAGGGEKAAAKQKEKGKMLARERISYLLDSDSKWLEIGAFAANQSPIEKIFNPGNLQT
jgi:acetyl-CoA carboxylase carboxyltransferase component